MSARPSDIPESVLTVAITLVREQADVETIARAILAAEKRGEERERERCALIAEDVSFGCREYADATERRQQRIASLAQAFVADQVAAAIRNPSHTKEGV